MEPIDLFISADLIKDAQELSNPLLKVPDAAFQGKGDTLRWTERLQIESTTVEKVEDSDRYAFKVKFKVSPLAPSPLNRGRNANGYFLYNPKAKGEDKDAFMSKITINRLDNLLRAVGFQTDSANGPVNYGKIFGDPEAPFKGREVNATITNKPDHKDPTVRRQEIANFTTVED